MPTDRNPFAHGPARAVAAMIAAGAGAQAAAAATPISIWHDTMPGVYARLDPATQAEMPVSVYGDVGGWRLRMDGQVAIRGFERLRYEEELENVGPAGSQRRRAEMRELSLGAERSWPLGGVAWLTAEGRLALPAAGAPAASERQVGSARVALAGYPGRSSLWAGITRTFQSSDYYLVRDTWRAEAGVSHTLPADMRLGLSASHWQSPHESWGSGSTLTLFADRETPHGRFRAYVYHSAMTGYSAVSGALMWESTFR